MIQKERLKFLNDNPVLNRDYVIYWMQASQRVEYNHALQYAILKANSLKKPLVVYFGLTDNFPEANLRHYYFMLEGLKEVESGLRKLGGKFVIIKNDPEAGAIKLSKRACLVVADRGYLKIQRSWRDEAAKKIDCQLVEVESDCVVPVEVASTKEEFSAATIRPKINRCLEKYVTGLKTNRPARKSLDIKIGSLSLKNIDRLVRSLDIDKKVPSSGYFHGGTNEAKRHLNNFLKRKINHFNDLRNDPSVDYLSNMSPYLHFGQISPLYIALKVMRSRSKARSAYLEELIIRRELSLNYIYYNKNYDSFEGLPNWAKKTLYEHKGDKRNYAYSLPDLENAKTHDVAWNAAQREMVITGKMHGYMRMYWGKKILEWSQTPEDAFKRALYLNNKYELDGRDPNGFTGVAWCFGKHDRAWGERKIFGKIRFMNEAGLRRKFDIDKYIKKVGDLKN